MGRQIWHVALMASLGCTFFFVALVVRYGRVQIKQRLRAFFSRMQARLRATCCICNSHQVSDTPDGSAAQDATAPPNYSDTQLPHNSNQTVVVNSDKLPPSYQDLYPNGRQQPSDNDLYDNYRQIGVLPPPPAYHSVVAENEASTS